MPKGYTFDSGNGPGVGMSSAGSSGSGSSSSGGSNFSSAKSKVNNLASTVSNLASSGTNTYADKIRSILENPATSARGANAYDSFISQYGLGFDTDEYLDMMMQIADYNNQWSADQAQKQMDYQTRSDQAAMAWSAQEAAKSRAWSENLSNTAHQREVKDLLAAGLNPILSANNGAWTGNGAMGQSHSSAGAMGQTDLSVGSNISAMMSNAMTTAKDYAMTRMQLEQQRYATDIQYQIAKMQAETSIYNNKSNIDANKAIRDLDRNADITRAQIAGNAQMQAASTSAGGMIGSANIAAQSAQNVAQITADWQNHRTDTEDAYKRWQHENLSADTKEQTSSNYWINKENREYNSQHDVSKDPIQYFGNTASNWYVEKGLDIADKLYAIYNRGHKSYNEGYDPYSNGNLHSGSARGF